MSKPHCRAPALSLPMVTGVTLACSSPSSTHGPSTALCACCSGGSADDTPAPAHTHPGQSIGPWSLLPGRPPLLRDPPGHHGKAGGKRQFWHSALWGVDCFPEDSHGPHQGLGKPCLTFQNPWEAHKPHQGKPRTVKLSALLSSKLPALTRDLHVPLLYSLQTMGSSWCFRPS